MLDFQKCGVLCNQWEIPLQICVLQIDVSHPFFAQTLHQRNKLAKCMFSKIYLKDFLHLNWTSCYVFVFLNSTFYGSIRHWPSHLWSMVCTCHALFLHCSCQLWFLWDQQALKQNSRDIYLPFCTLIWVLVLPNITIRSFVIPVLFSKTHSSASCPSKTSHSWRPSSWGNLWELTVHLIKLLFILQTFEGAMLQATAIPMLSLQYFST
jgi:hypothetical protein